MGKPLSERNNNYILDIIECRLLARQIIYGIAEAEPEWILGWEFLGLSLDSSIWARFSADQALCALTSLCTCVCQPPALPFVLDSSFALEMESSPGIVQQPPGLVFLEGRARGVW